MALLTRDRSSNGNSRSQEGTDDYAITAAGEQVTPGVVRSKWDVVKRTLIRERREFAVNQAFYLDEQWVRWDKAKDTVARVEFKDNDRVRLTVNRIRPNLTTLLAKLTGRPLRWEVLPDAPDDALVLGARTAEQVLSSAHDSQRWEHVRRAALLSSYLGGTSGVAVEWDTSKGVDLGVHTEEGRKVATGDIKLTSLNISEFGLQPGVRTPDDADWWIRALALPPAQVQDTYDLDWLPQADASAEQSMILLYDTSWRPFSDRCLVLSYFERPTKRNPSGLVGTCVGDRWVDGPHDWPFEFKDHLNVTVFRQTEVIGRWTGDTILSSVRPVQIAYNMGKSNLAEHMKKAGNARLAVPAGSSSMFDNLTDEPGEIIEYNQVLGEAKYISPPNLPQWMLDTLHDLEGNIDQIMGVTNAMTAGAGTDPYAGMSGIAYAQVAERNDTPLGLVAWDQANGWGDIGSQVLQVYAKMAKEPRRATGPGAGGTASSVKWDGKALQGQTRAQVPVDLVLPHSRIAQQSFAKEMFDASGGTMKLSTFAQLADLPNSEQMIEALDADVAKTERCMHLLAQGRVPIPAMFDDHAKAIAEGNRFRKSATYEQLPDDRRQHVDDWMQAHENMQAQQLGEQQQRAAVHPDLASVAQADEPPASSVPADAVEQQQAQAGAVPGGVGGGMPAGGQPVPIPGAPVDGSSVPGAPPAPPPLGGM